MRIDPLDKYVQRDFALLTPGTRCLYVETTYGKQKFSGKRDVTNALVKLKDFTCYVASGLQQLKHTTGASEWVLSTWRGRDVRMTHVPTGVKVVSLQSTLIDEPDPFAALHEALSWIRQFGVAPGSISGMAWKLLRASLNTSVSLGFDPEIAEKAFFGGRQEIWQPATYKNFKSVDIKAAYPTAMSSRPIATSLRKVSKDTELDPNESGLATAKVYVPIELPYAPLPVRIDKNAIQFQYHEIEGTWTWAELAAAKKIGCEVVVEESYAPRRTFDLFGTWWEMAQEGRNLSKGATLAKAIANSTWGQFSMRGDDRSEVHWQDDKGNLPFAINLPKRQLPHIYGLHVAAEVTARVRVQTLLEGLYGSKGWVIHVDTDGLIMHDSGELPTNSGENFGQWRVKDEINQIEIRAPQFYRYTKPGEEHRWHYVASGQTHDQAVRTFTRHPDTYTKISFLSNYDVCLPAGSSRRPEDVEAYLDELHGIAS